MDPSPTRTRRRGDRKRQLASVAAELFRARGYHGVGINDIAAAAGVTGPAIYRHFADKQAILAYVLISGLEEMESATAEALTALAGEDGDQVESLLGALAGQAVERREVAALWRWEGRHLAPEDQREIRRRSAALLAAWSKALLARRPELGTEDAELLCWAALSVYGSVSVHRTTVAKRRFVDLLAGLARRAVHTTLPTPRLTPPDATPALDLGEPSRREQILAAATELFRRRGFHAVSMEDIGAAAGIAGPSVYRHFPSKARLMVAICRRAADRLALGAEYALRISNPPDERTALRRLTESYVDTLTGSGELAVAFSSDPVTVAERDHAELVRVQRDYVGQWVRLLGAVHPGLNEREAKITVHAALTIANDLARTRRVRTRPHLHAELVTLMRTVLGID
jgi:AcrR family transcriptional regulator